MPKMKLFRGNWDGKRERAVVCATKKRAMELLGTSASHMRDMFNDSTDIRPDCASVWNSPEVVFERPMSFSLDVDNWKPIK